MILQRRIGRVKSPILLLVLAVLSLSGCEIIAPLLGLSPEADAGFSSEVATGEEVQLYGGHSSGDGLDFEWMLISRPSGSTATIELPYMEIAYLTPDVPGNYMVRLTVSNQYGESDDTIVITATGGGSGETLTPPSNLHLSGTAQAESVTLAWDAPATNVMNYKVMRLDIGSALYSIEVYSGAALTCVDLDVEANTAYSYKVMAFYGDPSYAWSALSTAFMTTTATLATAPSPPTGLYIAGQTQTSLTLYWTAPSGATGYKINKLASGSYSEIANNSTGATSYTDVVGLVADTTYYYQVIAYNGVGSSTPAAVSGKTAAAGVVAPDAPTGLAVGSATETSLVVSWTAPATAVDGFRLQRKTSATAWVDVATDLLGSATTFTNFGLSPGMGYYFQLFAFKGTGVAKVESAPSDTVLGSTLAAALPPYQAYTPAPANGSTGVPTAALILSWTAPYNPDGAALSYEVYVGAGGAAPVLKVSNLPTASWTPLAGTFLPGASYTWYVKSIDTHGHYSISPTWSFATATAIVYGPSVDAHVSTPAPYYIDSAISLVGTVTTSGSSGIISAKYWTIMASPSGSAATLTPSTDGLSATFTPNLPGTYTLEFKVVDGNIPSLSASVWIDILVGDSSSGGAIFYIH